MLTWDDYNADSGTESVPLLVSERSQSLILAAMQYLDFRSNWNEVDDTTWNDIEKSVAEAYQEIMTLRLLSESYRNRVLATNPLRYNPLSEGSGTTIIDYSGNGYTGTYSGIAWTPDFFPLRDAVPFWDGANDKGNLYSSTFATDFNLDEGCILLWVKPNSTSVWTDATNRYFLSLEMNANNALRLYKTSTNGFLRTDRRAGGVYHNADISGVSDPYWHSYLLSWSVAANQLKVYRDGIQIGTTKTGLIASTGSGLGVAYCGLGSQRTDFVTGVWHGYLSHLVFWDTPATADIIALGAL